MSKSTSDENVLRREQASLDAIKGSYPKYLLTMDLGGGNHNGIEHKNILDWLVAK